MMPRSELTLDIMNRGFEAFLLILATAMDPNLSPVGSIRMSLDAPEFDPFEVGQLWTISPADLATYWEENEAPCHESVPLKRVAFKTVDCNV